MNLSVPIAAASLLVSIPQGVLAIMELNDRFRPKASARSIAGRRRGLPLTLAVAVTAVLSALFGLLLLSHQLTIERPTHSAITNTTGPATTMGDNSPAVTGSSNSFNYGPRSEAGPSK